MLTFTAQKSLLKIGEDLILTASGEDCTTYEFKKDGKTVQNTSSNVYKIKAKSTDGGEYTLLGHSGDKEVTCNVTVNVVVQKNQLTSTLTLTPSEASINVKTNLRLVSSLTDVPDDCTVFYEWYDDKNNNVGKNDSVFMIYSTEPTKYSITLKVTISGDNYETLKLSATSNITVKIGTDSAPRYIHPLDQRESAFLQCGYWVLDEIKSNKDWKTNYKNLKYSDDLETISIMLDNYKDVEIQESRNGYIVKKSYINSL